MSLVHILRVQIPLLLSLLFLIPASGWATKRTSNIVFKDSEGTPNLLTSYTAVLDNLDHSPDLFLNNLTMETDDKEDSEAECQDDSEVESMSDSSNGSQTGKHVVQISQGMQSELELYLRRMPPRETLGLLQKGSLLACIKFSIVTDGDGERRLFVQLFDVSQPKTLSPIVEEPIEIPIPIGAKLATLREKGRPALVANIPTMIEALGRLSGKSREQIIQLSTNQDFRDLIHNDPLLPVAADSDFALMPEQHNSTRRKARKNTTITLFFPTPTVTDDKAAGSVSKAPSEQQPPSPTLPEQPLSPTLPEQPPSPTLPEQPPSPTLPEQPLSPTVPEQPLSPTVPEQPPSPTLPEQPPSPTVPEQPPSPTLPEQPPLLTVPEQLMPAPYPEMSARELRSEDQATRQATMSPELKREIVKLIEEYVPKKTASLPSGVIPAEQETLADIQPDEADLVYSSQESGNGSIVQQPTALITTPLPSLKSFIRISSTETDLDAEPHRPDSDSMPPDSMPPDSDAESMPPDTELDPLSLDIEPSVQRRDSDQDYLPAEGDPVVQCQDSDQEHTPAEDDLVEQYQRQDGDREHRSSEDDPVIPLPGNDSKHLPPAPSLDRPQPGPQTATSIHALLVPYILPDKQGTQQNMRLFQDQQQPELGFFTEPFALDAAPKQNYFVHIAPSPSRVTISIYPLKPGDTLQKTVQKNPDTLPTSADVDTIGEAPTEAAIKESINSPLHLVINSDGTTVIFDSFREHSTLQVEEIALPEMNTLAQVTAGMNVIAALNLMARMKSRNIKHGMHVLTLEQQTANGLFPQSPSDGTSGFDEQICWPAYRKQPITIGFSKKWGADNINTVALYYPNSPGSGLFFGPIVLKQYNQSRKNFIVHIAPVGATGYTMTLLEDVGSLVDTAIKAVDTVVKGQSQLARATVLVEKDASSVFIRVEDGEGQTLNQTRMIVDQANNFQNTGVSLIPDGGEYTLLPGLGAGLNILAKALQSNNQHPDATESRHVQPTITIDDHHMRSLLVPARHHAFRDGYIYAGAYRSNVARNFALIPHYRENIVTRDLAWAVKKVGRTAYSPVDLAIKHPRTTAAVIGGAAIAGGYWFREDLASVAEVPMALLYGLTQAKTMEAASFSSDVSSDPVAAQLPTSSTTSGTTQASPPETAGGWLVWK